MAKISSSTFQTSSITGLFPSLTNFNPIDSHQLSNFYNRDDAQARNIAFTQTPKKRAGQMTLTEMIPAMKKTTAASSS